MLLIYRKSDGTVLDNQGTNKIFPTGVPNVEPILKNIVSRFGGKESEYGILRLHDIEDVKTVDKTFTHEFTVKDEKIIFGSKKVVPEPEPQPPTIDEQITELKEKVIYVERTIKTPTEIYEENKDKEGISLEELKQLRINKLKDECSKAIYNGFIFKEQEFGFNINDQTNFTQQLLLILNGQTDNIQWKTKNDGVIELTVDEFKLIAIEAEAHKKNQQIIYWAREQKIIEATTKEEVKLISW